jgi:hypothetical protein
MAAVNAASREVYAEWREKFKAAGKGIGSRDKGIEVSAGRRYRQNGDYAGCGDVRAPLRPY